MTENPVDVSGTSGSLKPHFETITKLVSSEFQVEEALLDHYIPTYYLKWPQETKQPFLRLLRKLDEQQLIAFLRRAESRVILRVGEKPQVKPSNPLI